MARSQVLLNVLKLASTEELPVEQQFLNDLKASIEIQDEKNARKPSQTYKPSSMHCIRNMYFQITGAEGKGERASSELVGICENGTDRHERIQQAVMHMKDSKMDCEYVDVGDYVISHKLDYLDIVSKQGNETKLYHKNLNMSFLCDGIIRYKQHYYILEIKTEISNKWWDRKDVSPDHLLQGTAYSEAFNIPQVIFLYENRDNCAKKTFMLTVTQEMRESLVNKIKECDMYVAKKECPPKPEDISKKACAYCGYSELCKGMVQ